MAFDYAEISDTAEELIDEFGRQVMLRSAGAPDPATPWIAGVPVVTPGSSRAGRVHGTWSVLDQKFRPGMCGF